MLVFTKMVCSISPRMHTGIITALETRILQNDKNDRIGFERSWSVLAIQINIIVLKIAFGKLRKVK